MRLLPLPAIDVAPLPGSDDLLVLTYGVAEGAALRRVDPVTGSVVRTVPLPGVPSRFAREGYGPGMAVADDGSTAYVARSDSGFVMQVDLGVWRVKRSIVIPTLEGTLTLAEGLAVQPGHPDVLAVSLHQPYRSPSYSGLYVYVGGVRRPLSLPGHSGPSRIEFSRDPSLLHGIGDTGGGTAFYQVRITDQGAQLVNTHPVFSRVFTSDFVYSGGLFVSDQGEVAREAGYARVGTLPGTGYGTADVAGLLTSESTDRVYLVRSGSVSSYWLDDQSLAAQLDLGRVLSVPTYASTARWGDDGVAVSTGSALVLVENAAFTNGFSALFGKSALAFGPAASPQTRDVWVHNGGNVAVSVDTLSVEGPFVAGGLPDVIPARDSARVSVTFVPGRYGTNSTGTLTVATNQANSVGSRVRVTLSGRSTRPSIAEPVHTLGFPPVEVDSTSVRDILLRNSSTSDVVLSIAVGQQSAFSLPGGPEVTVSARSTRLVRVAFTPTALTAFRDTLVLHDEGSGITDTVALEGRGSIFASASFDPPALRFEGVVEGQTRVLPVVVHNSGPDTLRVTYASVTSQAFTFLPTAFTVPPGDSLAASVRFNGSTAAPLSGTVFLPSNTRVGLVYQVSASVGTAVSDGVGGPPFYLNAVAPHPVRSAARFSYGVAEPGKVRLDLYDALGRHVANVVDSEHVPGSYTAELDTGRLPPAVYVYRLTSQGRVASRTLVVVR